MSSVLDAFRPAGAVEQERAAARGMPIADYMNWRAGLRADYANTFPRTVRKAKTALAMIHKRHEHSRGELRERAGLEAQDP